MTFKFMIIKEYIEYNIGTIGVIIVLAVAVFMAVACMVKRKNNGKCSCGCEGCAISGFCGYEHIKEDKADDVERS